MKKNIPIPKPHHVPYLIFGVALVVLSIGLISALQTRQVYSATGDMYLVLGPTVQNGGELQTTVKINPGTKVDTVTASVSYDTDALTYKEVKYTASPFSDQIPAIVKNGIITIQSAKLGGQTIDSDALIAILTFTAKKNNPVPPKLIYGNAARAGVATNPTISGNKADKDTDPFAVTEQTNQTNGQSVPDDGKSDDLLSAPVSLLQKVGITKGAAIQAAPWFVGILLTLLLAGLTSLGLWLWKKYGKRDKDKNNTQEQDAHL